MMVGWRVREHRTPYLSKMGGSMVQQGGMQWEGWGEEEGVTRQKETCRRDAPR
jgi:hypothetical protein